MSVFKSKYELRTILDFSDGKVSKNQIKQSLKQVEVKYCTKPSHGWITFFNNDIKIGMYSIRLSLTNDDLNYTNTKIKQHKRVSVQVVEKTEKIYIDSDPRFSYLNYNYTNVSIDDLTNLIHHCKRLNDVRAFL